MRKNPKRAEVDATHPQGWATSDRNGHIGNLAKMKWQHDWRGSRIVNTRILVHEDELDEPQRQLGPPALLGPDPIPLANVRPESIAIDEVPVSVRIPMGTAFPGVARAIMQKHGASPINLIVTVSPSGVTDGNWTGP